MTVDLLVVGGGAGGGLGFAGAGAGAGGGGGAGQVRDVSGHTLAFGSYPVVIGAGGGSALNGANSSLDTILALGGGCGGSYNTGATSAGANGGSGGGGAGDLGSGQAAGTGTAPGGNSGGAGFGSGSNPAGGGGGGGGAVGAAGFGPAGNGGAGGAGLASTITGTTVTYGGGGGGAGWNTASGSSSGAGGSGGGGAGSHTGAPQAGTTNTGGGGGGGVSAGGAGGSGLVIVRYLTADAIGTGGTITTTGAYTLHTFTASGTFTLAARGIVLAATAAFGVATVAALSAVASLAAAATLTLAASATVTDTPVPPPSIYRDTILAAEPIGYWRLDELSGTFAEDSSGHGHHGTYADSPTLGAAGLTGDNNTAADFTGANEVDLGAVPAFSPTAGAFTIEAWCRPLRSFVGGTAYGVFGNEYGSEYGLMLRLESDAPSSLSGIITARTNQVGASSVLQSPYSLALAVNKPLYVVWTFTGTEGRLYQNGVLVAGPVAMTSPVASPVSTWIGNSNPLFVQQFNGILDDVAFYDRALTPAEVLDHYTVATSLRAAAGLHVATAAVLAPPALAATAGITFGTSARLLVPFELAIDLGGVPAAHRVRKFGGPIIRDILNDAPNTCQLTVEGEAPAVGQRLRITIAATPPRVLFAGTIQTIDHTFEGQPQHVAWTCTAIDDTARANARRPFGTWITTSATTIATAITPAGFSTAGIAAGLPAVTIVFDGSATFIACLAQLATAVGGYCKVEDNVVYLFLEDTTAPPDPIDADHPFLFDPKITINTDSSQLRTRVYGKGYGEQIRADVGAGETLLPIQDGVMFPPLGGTAIAGLTADAAQSERIAFTGVELAVGGTLVGPGAAPATAPVVALAAGTGIESGVHGYAYLFVTATGKSAPSPLAAISVVGTVPAPATPVTGGTPTGGGGLDPGSHRYYAVFRTAVGATTHGPASNAITAGAGVAPPSSGPISFPGGTNRPDGGLDEGAWYGWGFTFWDGTRETVLSPTVTVHLVYNAGALEMGSVPAPPAGFQVCWYRTEGGVSAPGPTYKRLPLGQAQGQFSEISAGYFIDIAADAALGPDAPTVDRSGFGTSLITAIPVSPVSLVTHVDLYREFNGAGAATAKLALSVTNGTTSATDTVANASLGATVPATNTAIGNRVIVTWPGGPAGVTNIELYRTAAGAAQLKLRHIVGSNTAGSLTDSTADAALGANAPTGDTSGLTQPQGQVIAGATVLPVASADVFRAGGGWAVLAGGQVVRYSARSGNTLTGIPAAGAGAITTTVLYGSQALPAPMLTGVTGLTVPMLKGAAVHLWIQVDDLAAQAEQAARDGTDGIVEYLISDARRGVASLTARCQADLAMFSRPIVTVSYATRDSKTRSGKTIDIQLDSPAISQTLTIQEVTISDLDRAPGLAPRFTVKASNVRFSLEDTLRRLIVA